MTKKEVIKACTEGVVIDADNLDNIYTVYNADKLYDLAIQNYLDENRVTESRKDSIRRFEILRTVFDNSDSEKVGKSFEEFALKYWDKVNMNYFNEIG